MKLGRQVEFYGVYCTRNLTMGIASNKCVIRLNNFESMISFANGNGSWRSLRHKNYKI